MRTLSASASIQIPHQLSSPLRKQAFPITTTTTTRKERIFFPQQPLSLRVVNSADESRVVPLAAAAAAAAVSKLRTDAKEEEVKSLLTLFLKNLSLKDTMEFCNTVHFIDNLVSKLYNIHIVEFPIGRELTQVEIRNALIPSIESLVEENLDILVKRKKLPIPHQTINNTSLDSIKPNAKVRVRSSSSNIQQPVGDFEEYSWKENDPLIEFILKLGVLESNIPMIIQTCPGLLKTSIQDVKSTVDYLYEMGLSKEDICTIINNYPNILRLSIDDKLRQTAEYFHSKGIDPCVLLRRRPRIWDRSLEHDLKPVTEFFLERGFSVDDFVTIALKLPNIFAFNVSKKLIPKWNFFLTLDYPRLEVTMFPLYFACSLEARIKPRYAQLRERGLKLSLQAVLLPSDDDFEKIVNSKVRKMRRRGSLGVNSHAGLRS